MTAGFFLGVDGGGTKTRFALMDGDRKLLSEAQLGTSYHPEVGLDGVRDVLAQGIAEVLAGAGIDASQIAYAFFGLPGYGEDSASTPSLRCHARDPSSATTAMPATTTWSVAGRVRWAPRTASTSLRAPGPSATGSDAVAPRAPAVGARRSPMKAPPTGSPCRGSMRIRT